MDLGLDFFKSEYLPLTPSVRPHFASKVTIQYILTAREVSSRVPRTKELPLVSSQFILCSLMTQKATNVKSAEIQIVAAHQHHPSE